MAKTVSKAGSSKIGIKTTKTTTKAVRQRKREGKTRAIKIVENEKHNLVAGKIEGKINKPLAKHGKTTTVKNSKLSIKKGDKVAKPTKVATKKSVAALGKSKESSTKEADYQPVNPTKEKFTKKSDDRCNKLYIKLKKKIQDTVDDPEELKNMHPDILSISLPRRGEKERFFFAEFESEETAFAAMQVLRKSGTCFVNLPRQKKASQPVFEKESKKMKGELRSIWK